MKRIIFAIIAIALFVLTIALNIHMTGNSTILERFIYVMCILLFPVMGFIALQEKSSALASKRTNVKTQYDYMSSGPNYASVFREGMPVITTDDYYGGKGFHAVIVMLDKSEDGMPLLIQLCGGHRKEWVSENEVIPEYEMEVVL